MDRAGGAGADPTAPTRRELLAIGASALVASNPLVRRGHRRRHHHHHHHHHHHRHRKHHRNPLAQIEHIVVVQQENCSFDHYFGTLRGVRGFSDPKAPRLAGGGSVFAQPWGTGTLLPWHLDTATADPCETTVSNAWDVSHASVDGDRMDNFAGAGGPDTMRYYTRADLPWHMALADAFTVLDGYHCSVLGPTNPNRLYTWSGTIDPAAAHGGPVIDNSQTPPYTWTTYPERLQAAGISWRVYQQTDNFDDNALAWFSQYQQARPGSPLYENGIRARGPTGFADDVAAGALPQISWVISPAAQSEHPGYAPGAGADFCNGILGSLFAHPKVWAKTVLILSYDEGGGYFDHVPPPLPPAGTADEFVSGAPIGLGVRVPTIVCSPFARGGYVCSDTFDHTSTIRLMELRFGVMEPNISAWRRATCGDLTTCLDLTHGDLSTPSLPATAPLASASANACSRNPPALPPLLNQQMPAQEPGTRPRRG